MVSIYVSQVCPPIGLGSVEARKLSEKVTILKLPRFAESELSNIKSDLSPVEVDIRELLAYQEKYNRKAVSLEGLVRSVINIDEIDEATVATWFFETIPTTASTTASATYFYVENEF